MIRIWEETTVVDPHDVDLNDNVRPTVMLQYMQTAAVREFYHTKPSLEQLRREQNRTYLLSSLSMEIDAPLTQHTPITAQSWACPSKHCSFLRCGRVMTGNRLIARMYSVWALVDLSDKHLISVEEAPCNFSTEETLNLPTRFRIPKDADLKRLGERRISYHDCDVNRHMNNTRYVDMFCDCLPMIGQRVSSVMIRYCAEAPLGETLTVFGQEIDGCTYFRAERSDGTVATEAAIRLCSL